MKNDFQSLWIGKQSNEMLCPTSTPWMMWCRVQSVMLLQLNHNQIGFNAKLRRSGSQCDQMARLFFQFLAVYCNESLPHWRNVCQSRLTILPNTKWTLQRLANGFKILAKWWDFAKSGHTGGSSDKIFCVQQTDFRSLSRSTTNDKQALLFIVWHERKFCLLFAPV